MSSPQKREQILDAAERVFRSKGLSGATTREIAREVGCADGTLYLHFDDRLALFLAIVERTIPGYRKPLENLQNQVGLRTVRGNLEDVLHGALGFQDQIMPMVASLFAEPELLNNFRDVLRRGQQGPLSSLRAVEDYLRAEQQFGRVPKRLQPRAVAFSLLGACFYRTFLNHLLGEPMSPGQDAFVRGLVSALDLRVTRTPKLSTKAGRLQATTPDLPAKSESPISTTPPESRSQS